MGQFIQGSTVPVWHLNILLCITWKFGVTEWTFASRWEEMGWCLCSSSSSGDIPPVHLALPVGGWEGVMHAALHNSSVLAANIKKKLSRQSLHRACKALPKESVFSQKPLDLRGPLRARERARERGSPPLSVMDRGLRLTLETDTPDRAMDFTGGQDVLAHDSFLLANWEETRMAAVHTKSSFWPPACVQPLSVVHG